MKMLCGFPMGVIMLPRLAAMVSMTIIKITLFESMHFRNSRVRGTKVISVMSLVMTIDEKKHTKISIRESFLTLTVLEVSLENND